MKAEMFAELLKSANEALEHAQGKRSLKSTTLSYVAEPMGAKSVRAVRETLQASQAVLAQYLNVSTKLVQAWEANRRQPVGPALVLLHMIKQQPGLVATFYDRPATTKRLPSPKKSIPRNRRVATVRK